MKSFVFVFKHYPDHAIVFVFGKFVVLVFVFKYYAMYLVPSLT